MSLKKGRISLPNGCGLYWTTNPHTGRTYYSDEIGGGVFVWDPTLVDKSTLLAAIVNEERLLTEERHKKGVRKLNQKCL